MSHEGDITALVYRTETRKAARSHRCTACGERIRVGDPYADVFILADGGTYRFKRCGRCEKIHAHLREKCRAGCDGRWPDENLRCGEYYRENWGEDPPTEIAALAFALPGETVIGKGQVKT